MKSTSAAELRRQAEERLRRQASSDGAGSADQSLRVMHELQVHQIELEMQNEELRATRAELEEAVAAYTDLYDFAPVGYFTVDRDGRIIRCNLAGARLLGAERVRLLQRNLGGYLAVGGASDFSAYLRRVFAAEGPVTYEVDLAIPTSHGLHVRLEATASADQSTCRLAVVDISALHEATRRQAALLDAATDAIHVRSLDDKVTYWNRGAERLYGWTQAEAMGRRISDLGDIDPSAFAAATAALLQQGSWIGELKKRTKQGQALTVFCHWTLLRDARDRPSEVLAINSDVTERKLLEAKFLRAQRAENIGTLASGVAHDLNNILAPILLAGPMLRAVVVKDEDHALVDMVESCAKRGAQIIRQLLTYARGQPETRLQLPVRHLLREMETIMAETFPKNIGTSVAVSPDLWPVLADITQVQQAVMNLCVNARDAMPEGGSLKLAAANAAVDETFEDAVPDAKPGPYVCLSVADSGMGIPAHHLEKIFDPFFTTKEIGKGTGLGLATVLGIARGHAGFVRVRSREGAGAVFEIYLPAAPLAPDPDGTAPGNRALKPRGAGELVLVVDDERAVTRTAQLTLQQHGYTVLVAQDGVEALAIYAQQHAAIKAVVTDMMMPGMDGPTLVQNLQRLDPRLPIVGMTGLHDDETVAHLAKFGLISLLAKPCTAPELLQALERALALGPSTADSGPGRIGGG